MPEDILNITDAQLLEKLKNSFIADEQKNELVHLLPDMTQAERAELLDLINRSGEELAPFVKNEQEALETLNRDYQEKMETVKQENEKTARVEFETLEQQENEGALKAVEQEVGAMSKKTEEQAAPVLPKTIPKKSHFIRNLILLFGGLILLAGAILYIVTTL